MKLGEAQQFHLRISIWFLRRVSLVYRSTVSKVTLRLVISKNGGKRETYLSSVVSRENIFNNTSVACKDFYSSCFERLIESVGCRVATINSFQLADFSFYISNQLFSLAYFSCYQSNHMHSNHLQ